MRTTKRIAAMAAAAMLANAAVLPAAVFADTSSSSSSLANPSSSEQDAAASPAGDAQQGDMVMTKENADALARKLAQIPSGYALQSANYGTELLADGKRAVWSLYYVHKENGKNDATISVSVDAGNEALLSFETWEDDRGVKPTYPLKVEREAAKEIAADYIREMAPQYADEVTFNEDYGAQLVPPLTGEVRHSLRFDRVVNGIPYVDNHITLEVDSEGHVASYRVEWDGTIVFPTADAKLSVEEANGKLTEIARPELTYMMPYEGETKKKKPVLGYMMESAVVDAQTGEQVKERYSNERTVSDRPVSAVALGDKPSGGPLTVEQAEQAVKKLFAFPANAELTGSSYSEYEDGSSGQTSKYWHLDWTVKEGGKDVASINASVDSGSGAVTSYYSYEYDSTEAAEPKISYEKAKSLAEDAVKKLIPWAANELYLVSDSRYEGELERNYESYSISFEHKVNGAFVSYDSVRVSIDAQTGEVVSFDAGIADLDYGSSLPEVLTEEEAAALWLTYYRTVLTYHLTNQYWVDGKIITPDQYKVMAAAGEWTGDRVEQKSEVKLVYRLVPRPLDESVFLNAETGQWINSGTGDVTQLEKPEASDIEGHWAENELSLMVTYKALDLKDGQVRPNETITRGELIKMLVLAMNSGNSPYFAAEAASFADVGSESGYYKYVESALQQDLIDIGDGSFNPEGKVDREEMAELIVRALGYNSLANYDDLFNVSFTDGASVEKKGQAAIVVGLGIMGLNDGKFEADRLVTRAEASAAFFRYLQVRADLKEAPLRN